MSSKSVEERFWEKVAIAGPDDCWVWRACIQTGGYGRFRLDDGTVYAHRLAYELKKRPIPEGLQIDHRCRVRNCVNPDHLEPVSGRENVLRGESPAARHAVKTHCPRGHAYDEDNTYVSRGKRQCCTCRRDRHVVSHRVTHCPRGHAYDKDNTYVYRGRRDCRTCRRDRNRARRQAGKK